MDKYFINVILLGLAFMLIFTSLQTCVNIQPNVVKSINDEYSSKWGGKWDSNLSVAILYIVFALANWAAPSCVALLGPRLSMFISALAYCAWISSFLYPFFIGLPLFSALTGLGAAILWTGQGNFLTLNSTPTTISRNMGVFWALFQGSMIIGNLVVYFVFQSSEISDKERITTFSVLTGFATLGTFMLLTLRNIESEGFVERPSGPLIAIKNSAKLLKTKNMILLCFAFLFTGFELSFFSGIYSPSLSRTKAFGNKLQSIQGISGVLIGAGEILGGGLFGIFGKRFRQFGRNPIILLGFIGNIITFVLIFINIPPDANQDNCPCLPTDSIILPSFLLGFADSCYNTQVYSMLSDVYKEDSAPAFAIFKFFQSTAAGVAFFYSNYINIHHHIYILLITCIIGSITFALVERGCSRHPSEVDLTDESPTPPLASHDSENASDRILCQYDVKSDSIVAATP